MTKLAFALDPPGKRGPSIGFRMIPLLRASRTKKRGQRKLHISYITPNTGSPKQKKFNKEYTTAMIATHRQYQPSPLGDRTRPGS